MRTSESDSVVRFAYAGRVSGKSYRRQCKESLSRFPIFESRWINSADSLDIFSSEVEFAWIVRITVDISGVLSIIATSPAVLRSPDTWRCWKRCSRTTGTISGQARETEERDIPERHISVMMRAKISGGRDCMMEWNQKSATQTTPNSSHQIIGAPFGLATCSVKITYLHVISLRG